MDLNKLNREQRCAAETLQGPVLILAGAGSGKTRALTYRLANLIDHGVPSYKILALTFTNKAAKEMKKRVADLIGQKEADDAWISTFHSTCARILRRDIEKLGYNRSFAIYDDDDQNRVMKEILKKLNIDENFISTREIRGKISDAKNRLMNPDDWFRSSSRDRRCSLIHDVMVEYEKRMKTLNALDFDDLLLKTLVLFAEHPPVLQAYKERFTYVMVDEYQDTNKAQYEMVRMLTSDSRNLCVVGDDDQSIYGWRGADIRNILDFEKDYPDAKVIKLEQNYRSTANILDAANQVIARNQGRKDKKLWTEHEAGEKIQLYRAADEHDESMWIASKIRSLPAEGYGYGQTAILYRTNAQSRVPEEMLMKSGIPYRVFGGQKFYERKEIKDILAYLRVIVNPTDDISLLRIINVPRRSIGDTTVQAIQEYAAENNMSIFETLNELPDTVGSRARKSVESFFSLMSLLGAMKECLSLPDFLNELIEKTGLEEAYRKENTEEALERIANMDEFRNALREYDEQEENPTLESYLENIALVTDLDRAEDEHGYVTMMTLHSAKGLEFDCVFIPGLEENIFPSMRSVAEEDKLEEERRLMYVGITRARKLLFLSYAGERMMYNQYSHNPPSRFIREIPAGLLSMQYNNAGREGRIVRMDQGYRQERVIRGRNSTVPAANENYGRPADHTKAKLTFKGKSLDNIPGVSKGFGGLTVESAAKGLESNAYGSLFAAGDRVMHSKFGPGKVLEVSGKGKDARIRILFEKDHSEKTLALAIAPIVRMEETE